MGAEQSESGIGERFLKPQRQAMIRKLVEERGTVTVPTLSARFGVSEATVRRDLGELVGQGWIRRAHGGAVRVERAAKEPPMLDRMHDQAEAKRRIGLEAAVLVRDGETIFLGSGTTVVELAQALPETLRLTVITNSLPVANHLAARPQVEIIVIGGMFRPNELSMVGHIAELAIRELRADRVFMGMRGIDPAYGFTNEYLPEIMTDRAILGIAPRIVVLADHTKFGQVSSVAVAPVTAAHVIITDTDAPAGIVAQLRELGLEVRLV